MRLAFSMETPILTQPKKPQVHLCTGATLFHAPLDVDRERGAQRAHNRDQPVLGNAGVFRWTDARKRLACFRTFAFGCRSHSNPTFNHLFASSCRSKTALLASSTPALLFSNISVRKLAFSATRADKGSIVRTLLPSGPGTVVPLPIS